MRTLLKCLLYLNQALILKVELYLLSRLLVFLAMILAFYDVKNQGFLLPKSQECQLLLNAMIIYLEGTYYTNSVYCLDEGVVY